jgi:hypothetical protein
LECKNTGRIYLAVYPERCAGQMLHAIQQVLARPKTDIYLLGYYNLLQSLEEFEAREIFAILESSQASTMLELVIDELRIVETHDDLCLSGRVISCTRGHGG